MRRLTAATCCLIFGTGLMLAFAETARGGQGRPNIHFTPDQKRRMQKSLAEMRAAIERPIPSHDPAEGAPNAGCA